MLLRPALIQQLDGSMAGIPHLVVLDLDGRVVWVVRVAVRLPPLDAALLVVHAHGPLPGRGVLVWLVLIVW